MKWFTLVFMAVLTGILLSIVWVKPTTSQEMILYKTTKLSPNVVVVTCRNGADPTVIATPKGVTKMLLVSCGTN